MFSTVLSSYIYHNELPALIFAENSPFNERYKAVYSRPLKLYKGTNNSIYFLVQTQDQRKYDLRTSVELAAATIPTGGAGKGYTAGDVLTINGGISTEPMEYTPTGGENQSEEDFDFVDTGSNFVLTGTVAQITVTTVSTTGAITGFTISEAGLYSFPPSATNNLVTGGTGTKAAFNLSWGTLATAQLSFNLIDDDQQSILVTKAVTVVDAVSGKVLVEVTPEDLIDITSNRINYSLGLYDPTTAESKALYVDSNYGVRGQAEVVSGHYPEHAASTTVSFPVPASDPITAITETYPVMVDNLFTSSSVFMDAGFKRGNSLHTAQFFFDTGAPFTGSVTIEASSDLFATFKSAPNTVTWSNVSTTALTAQVDSYFSNFEGVYTAVRFKITPTSGTLAGIQYRN